MSAVYNITQKDIYRSQLLREFGLPKKTRATIYIALQDEHLTLEVSEACRMIGVIPMHTSSYELLSGVDILVYDLTASLPISFDQFLVAGIVPVIPYHQTTKFMEFNPMRFEGNAFFYDKKHIFSIFEKIVRALENMRYAGDRRILLKNVMQT